MGWALARRIVLLTVVVVVAAWLLVALRAVALQALFALILAAGLHVPVERLQQRGLPRAAAVLLIYLGVLLALGLLVVAVVPLVVQEIDAAVASLPRVGEWLTGRVRALEAELPFLPPLDQQLAAQLGNLVGQFGLLAAQGLGVARFTIGVFGGLLDALFVLLLTLYLVVDGDAIREYLLGFVPSTRRAHLREVGDRMGRRMGGWLLGQLALSGAVGAVTFAGLSVLGVPGAVLLAVIAGIGEAIPIMGPILSAVPAVIVAATQGPLQALLVAGLYLLVQQLENNLLVPKIMERAVQVHPLAVVLALVIGGELLGVGGAIVAVPVAATLAVALDEVRRSSGLASPTPGASLPTGSSGPAPGARHGLLPDASGSAHAGKSKGSSAGQRTSRGREEVAMTARDCLPPGPPPGGRS